MKNPLLDIILDTALFCLLFLTAVMFYEFGRTVAKRMIYRKYEREVREIIRKHPEMDDDTVQKLTAVADGMRELRLNVRMFKNEDDEQE